MIASCPACSARFHVRESTSAGTAEAATCPRCNTRFLVHAVRLPPAPVHAQAPGSGHPVTGGVPQPAPQNVATLDFSVVGITWRVHRGPSLPVYELHRLQELRGFLGTGQITPADQISHDGARWIDIASITDLDAYFWSVWQNALNPGADPGDVPTVLGSQQEAAAARLEAQVTETPDEAQVAWFSAHTVLPVEGSGEDEQPDPVSDSIAETVSDQSLDPVPVASPAIVPEELDEGDEPLAARVNRGPAPKRFTPEAIVPGPDSGTPVPPQVRAAPAVAAEPPPAAVAVPERPPAPRQPDQPALSPSPALPRISVSGPEEPTVTESANEPTETIGHGTPLPGSARAPIPTMVPVEPPHLEAPGAYSAGPAPLQAEVVEDVSDVFAKGDLGFSEEDLDDPPRVVMPTPVQAARPTPVSIPSPVPLRSQASESLRPTLLRGGPAGPVPSAAPQPSGAPPAPGIGVPRHWNRSTKIMAAAFAGGVSLTIGAFVMALLAAVVVGWPGSTPESPVVEGLQPRADATARTALEPVAPATVPVPEPPPRSRTRRRSSSRGAAVGAQASVASEIAPAASPEGDSSSNDGEVLGLPGDLEGDPLNDPFTNPNAAPPSSEPEAPERAGLPDDLLGRDDDVGEGAEVGGLPPEGPRERLPLKEEASSSEAQPVPEADSPADGG